MFYSEKLKKFQNLQHCFFSRKNGVSKGFYESLNCGLGSRDIKANVLKNLELVSNKINCKKESLITLNQKHSTDVIYFEKKEDVKNRLYGDAIICKEKNIAISILAADCAPILFYDPINKIIGCAHSGWKGALHGIIENTVKKFNDLGTKNENLIIAIGPCINKNNYEVKKKFFNNFTSKDKKNESFFDKIDDENFRFDLRGYINNKISNLDIQNVENIEVDTFEQKEFFFSYRRSCLEKQDDYGRCISVILMT